ncbi:hypothetical protein HDU83_007403 [Entophlyctis luteolus]|nr:hypothetical protein HDU83_007403 [Entophlyctis luteolus]
MRPPHAPASTGNFHAGGSGGVLLNSNDLPSERIDPTVALGGASPESDSDQYEFHSEDDEDEEDDDFHHDHDGSSGHRSSPGTGSVQEDGRASQDSAEQRQADMRKQIVAIQQDTSIPPQEKAKRIQDKDQLIMGCKHYQRSCKLQAHCCGKWFPCRFCHDEVSDHNIIRYLSFFTLPDKK